MKRFKMVRQRENDALGWYVTYIIRDHHCYWQITTNNYGNVLKFLILFILSSYFISHCKSKCFPTSLPGFVEFPPTLIFTSCSHAGQKAGTTYSFGTRGSLARKNCQGELARLLRDTKPYFYWRIDYTYIGKLYVTELKRA